MDVLHTEKTPLLFAEITLAIHVIHSCGVSSSPSWSPALTSQYMCHLHIEHLGPPSSGHKNTSVSIKGIDNLQMVWIIWNQFSKSPQWKFNTNNSRRFCLNITETLTQRSCFIHPYLHPYLCL